MAYILPRDGMFKLVADMNTAFGNKQGDPAKINANMLMKQVGTHERGNVHSELKEFAEELARGNVDGIRDSLCDIMVFVLGAFHRMGIDAERDMASVVNALYSRFCRDESHLRETQQHYMNKGVAYYVEGEFPTKCLKSLVDQYVLDGKVHLMLMEGTTIPVGAVLEYPKGKFLKAVGYEQPVFYKLPDPPEDPLIAAARIRDELKRREAGVRKAIESEVSLLRARLEKELLGLEPYDDKLNQCGSGDPEALRRFHESVVEKINEFVKSEGV